MGKLIWTTLVSVVILFIAQKIGWIGLGSELPALVANTIWNHLLWLGVIAVAFTVVSFVCGKLYGIVAGLTCGIALFLFPVYFIALGYVQLAVTAYLIPGFTYTTIWWQVLILSIFVGINAYTGSSNSSTHKSSASSSN